MYPNPNNGSFTLVYNLGNATNGYIEFYNEVGMKVGVFLLTSPSGTMPIVIQNMSEGVYFYKIFADNKVLKIGKVVIIK